MCNQEQISVLMLNQGITKNIDEVGCCPQTTIDEATYDVLASGGLPDAYQLHPKAKWTDVLSPRGPHGGRGAFLVNDRFVAATKSFCIGLGVDHPVTVIDEYQQRREYRYVRFDNEIPTSFVDFKRSNFYVANSAGFKQWGLAIDSFEEFTQQYAKANSGKFRDVGMYGTIDFKPLVISKDFRGGHHLFTARKFHSTTTYISSSLAERLTEVEITGIEIIASRRVVWEDKLES